MEKKAMKEGREWKAMKEGKEAMIRGKGSRVSESYSLKNEILVYGRSLIFLEDSKQIYTPLDMLKIHFKEILHTALAKLTLSGV